MSRSSIQLSPSSAPLTPRDRRRGTLFNLSSTIFHRKTFYFVGNFKQYNDNLSQKDIEKAVTTNGGQITLSIHSLTGKNSFLVVASDPTIPHDYLNLAKKNKANIVPVSFIIKSLELLAANRNADVQALKLIIDDTIKPETCQEFEEMFITNLGAAERVKQLENVLEEKQNQTENAQLELTRKQESLKEVRQECERLREALQQEASERRQKEAMNKQLLSQVNTLEANIEAEKRKAAMRERELLDQIALLQKENSNSVPVNENAEMMRRYMNSISRIEGHLYTNETEIAKALAVVRKLR